MKQGILITVRRETVFTCDEYESTWIDLESVDGKDKTLLQLLSNIYEHAKF